MSSSPHSSRQNSSSLTFEDWRLSNYDLIPFLDFFSQNQRRNSSISQQFLLKKTGMHQRALESLKNFTINIKSKEDSLRKEIATLSEKEPSAKGLDFIYDDQTINTKMREICFLKKKIWKNSLKILNKQLAFYVSKKDQCMRFSLFFGSKMLPNNMAAQITQNFFDLTFEDPEIKQKIKRLEQKINSIRHEIIKTSTPVWVTDFDQFFSNLVSKASHVLDNELFFFPFIDEEISFSRALFCASSSANRRAIDNFICRCAKNDFVDFPDRIIEFCAALVPPSSLESPKDQSISLLLYFRAIMDRIYETHTEYFSPTTFSNYTEPLYNLTMAQMTLPKGMSPAGEMTDLARTCFLKNHLYKNATITFLCAYFTVNPIDCLYYIHTTMADIHRAAISTLVNRTPTTEELKQILGFDDLFSLFFGVLVASDVPDPFQLHAMMQKFAPKSCLSPMFDYANANLEALVLHCKKICSNSIALSPHSSPTKAQPIQQKINENIQQNKSISDLNKIPEIATVTN